MSACASQSPSGAPASSWPDYISRLQPTLSESTVAADFPDDLAIDADANTAGSAPATMRWLGRWHGWACRRKQCDIKIGVEHIGVSKVRLVYAAASSEIGQYVERVTALFSGDELRATLRTGSTLTMRLRNTGAMEMMVRNSADQLVAAGVLQKGEFTYTRRLFRITTPWFAQGKAVTLNAVSYRPSGDGPFPTIVVNHGSTRLKHTARIAVNPDLAAYFARRGWLVVFPQRRGRGGSDGAYEEGLNADRTGYACTPDVAIAGFDHALEDVDVIMTGLASRDDVDENRMVIAGLSRGGVLAAAYAATKPDSVRGVVNFVGGWMGQPCEHIAEINGRLFSRAAAYPEPTLWLYGDRDPFYSLNHSRANFERFRNAGGQGSFVVIAPPAAMSGHAIAFVPSLWSEAVNNYLNERGLP